MHLKQQQQQTKNCVALQISSLLIFALLSIASADSTTTTQYKAAATSFPTLNHHFPHLERKASSLVAFVTSSGDSTRNTNEATTQKRYGKYTNSPIPSFSSSTLFDSPNNKNEDKDASYYQGFINRDVTEEPVERVSGDALLGPTLKLAGGTTVVMGVLVLVFMASNGLL